MSRRTIPWALLGLAGSATILLSSSSLLEGPVRWWTANALLSGTGGKAALIAGLALLGSGWLGLGRGWARDGPPAVRVLVAIGCLWSLPLALGPAIFSSDVYSYLAQGLLVHLGVDPYRHSPSVLAALGHPHVLSAVSPFWRHTTAPYGPGFLGLATAVAAVSASHLQLSVVLLRIPEVAGLGLVAIFAPRLARLCGADPARAVWLAVLSPLVLIELIGAAHNDALMAGLLVAGICLAMEGRTAGAVALCALAAAVKLPAAAAIPFIAAAEMRAQPHRAGWIAAQAALLSTVVLVLVTVAAGLGPDWLSGSVLSTPGLVRLSITPSTDVGWVIAHLGRILGLTINERSLEFSIGKLMLIVPACLGGILLARVRRETLVQSVGMLLLSLVVFGPAAWPWYLVWGLVLLACLPAWQSRPATLLLLTVPVFLIYANGQLRPSLGLAPWVLCAYALGGLAALRRRAMPGAAVSPPRPVVAGQP